MNMTTFLDALKVTYKMPTATDALGIKSLSCSPTSDSLFITGNNTVTCTATDNSGITSTMTFYVNIIKVEAPAKPIITVNMPSSDVNTTIEGNNLELKIIVMGNVKNKIAGNDQIKVTLKDPTGYTVYDANIKVDAQGNFNNEFDNPLFVKNMRDSGKYSFSFAYGDVINSFSWNYKTSVYVPPVDLSTFLPNRDQTGYEWQYPTNRPVYDELSTRSMSPDQFKIGRAHV